MQFKKNEQLNYKLAKIDPFLANKQFDANGLI
jgi:hypothetical protein